MPIRKLVIAPIREMVTVSDAARRLGVSRQTIHNRINSYDLYVEECGAMATRRAVLFLVDLLELYELMGVAQPTVNP